jgi:hypothetical protein
MIFPPGTNGRQRKSNEINKLTVNADIQPNTVGIKNLSLTEKTIFLLK